LLHISSDYVFPGGHPPYAPEDRTAPVNPYGQSKLAAEQHIRDLAPEAAILRVPVLFGPTRTAGESNITALAATVAHGRRTRVDHTVRRYTTHVDDVTTVCRGLAALTRATRTPCGVWHYSNPLGHSKYDLARLIAATHGLPDDHLSPDHTPLSDRPGDCRLDCSALHVLLGAAFPSPPPETFTVRVRVVTRPWVARERL
jgi:S-adenosylmethionine synthetase